MTTDHNSSTLNVVVTGAAGRLGRAVARQFHQSGFTVLATDIITDSHTPYRFVEVDLRDHVAVTELLDGADAVLHMGNHPGIGNTPPQLVFNDNVTMNENVFQGAAETGVRAIVFASTIQLIGSKPDLRTVVAPPPRPDFPVSGATLGQPSNVYALSKHVSEHMLRYYAECCGVSATALRLPLLHNGEAHFAVRAGNEVEDDIYEGFTGLTYADAARLFESVVRADLQGYHVFIAAEPHRHVDLSLTELAERFFPESGGNVVDLDPVTASTGWTPSAVHWPVNTIPETQIGAQE